jgi:hypothetical protein
MVCLSMVHCHGFAGVNHTSKAKADMYLDDSFEYRMAAIGKPYLVIACFFTDCSFNGPGELSKVLMVHHRYQ